MLNRDTYVVVTIIGSHLALAIHRNAAVGIGGSKYIGIKRLHNGQFLGLQISQRVRIIGMIGQVGIKLSLNSSMDGGWQVANHGHLLTCGVCLTREGFHLLIAQLQGVNLLVLYQVATGAEDTDKRCAQIILISCSRISGYLHTTTSTRETLGLNRDVKIAFATATRDHLVAIGHTTSNKHSAEQHHCCKKCAHSEIVLFHKPFLSFKWVNKQIVK